MAMNYPYANHLAPLPTGTLTFLFSDIESSTRLWESYPDKMNAVMKRHDELIESSVARTIEEWLSDHVEKEIVVLPSFNALRMLS
jgi:class 3 adenylate cyclase